MEPRRQASWTIQRRLNIVAWAYILSVLINLAISTAGVAIYLRPAFQQTYMDVLVHAQIEEARGQVRSISRRIERSEEIDPAEVFHTLSNIYAEIRDSLPGGLLAQDGTILQKLLSAQRLVSTPGTQAPLIRTTLIDTDRLLSQLAGRLEQHRNRGLDRAMSFQRNLLAIVTINSLTGVGLGLLGLWSVRKWLIQPVFDLRRATEEIGRGNPAVRLNLPFRDEIADLGQEIERMGGRIAHMQQQLLDRERRVAAAEMVKVVQDTLRARLDEIRAVTQAAGESELDGDIASCQASIRSTIERFQAWLQALERSFVPDTPSITSKSVRTLIQNVAHVLQPLLETRRVELGVDVVPALPEVSIDADQLEQALVALVTNAVEASRPGATVRIAAQLSESGGDLVICVEDSGCGIPPEIREQIFMPFFTTKPQGNGVGLAMVKTVVESHGGTTTVEAEVGQGSRFVITLPLSSGRPAGDQVVFTSPESQTHR